MRFINKILFFQFVLTVLGVLIACTNVSVSTLPASVALTGAAKYAPLVGVEAIVKLTLTNVWVPLVVTTASVWIRQETIAVTVMQDTLQSHIPSAQVILVS